MREGVVRGGERGGERGCKRATGIGNRTKTVGNEGVGPRQGSRSIGRQIDGGEGG